MTDRTGHYLEPLLTSQQLADHLGVKVGTVYDWRAAGTGPPAYQMGRYTRYKISDVDGWLGQFKDVA